MYIVDINECLSNPCVNGADCINTPGGYTCNCKDGWTGLNCANGQSLGQFKNIFYLNIFKHLLNF